MAASISFAVALLASNWSYWLWSRAGIVSVVLLVASPLAGLVMIAIEKVHKRGRDVMWPGLLVLLTGLILSGLGIASYHLEF